MTIDIIAIDERDLVCPECGNTDPKKFAAITTPCMHDGRIRGITLSGVTCRVCETSIGFEHVANSSFG
jgi:rubredoxin